MEAQKNDKYSGPILNYMMNKQLPEDEIKSKEIVASTSQLTIVNGLLHHLWWPQKTEKSDKTRCQLLVSLDLRGQLLEMFHDNPLSGGYLGFNKTFERIRE